MNYFEQIKFFFRFFVVFLFHEVILVLLVLVNLGICTLKENVTDVEVVVTLEFKNFCIVILERI
jgi:hypothetical protein